MGKLNLMIVGRRSGQSFVPCALVHSGSGPWTIVLLKGDLAKQSLRSHFEGQPMQLRLQACVENGPKPVGAQADGDGGGSVTETLRDGTQVVAHSPDKVEDGKEDAGFQMVHRNLRLLWQLSWTRSKKMRMFAQS